MQGMYKFLSGVIFGYQKNDTFRARKNDNIFPINDQIMVQNVCCVNREFQRQSHL